MAHFQNTTLDGLIEEAGGVIRAKVVPRRVTAAEAAALVFDKGEVFTISDTDEVGIGDEAETTGGLIITGTSGIVLIYADGSGGRAFRPTADTDEARGVALEAAVAAAVENTDLLGVGDLVVCNCSCTITSTLWKAGLSLHFGPNAVIVADGVPFLNGTTSGTVRVTNFGSITSNNANAIVTSHATAIVSMAGTGGVNVTGSGQYAVNMSAGVVSLAAGGYSNLNRSGGTLTVWPHVTYGTITGTFVRQKIFGTTPTVDGLGILGAADYSAMRTLLSLVPGTNVQAYDAELAALAGLTSAADKLPYFTGSGTAALADFTAQGRKLVANANATRRTIQFLVFAPTQDVTTGDGAAYAQVPSILNGHNIVSVRAVVITAGTTGTTDIQIARIRIGTPADTLTTKITIDSGGTDSASATTPAVINTSNDDLATGDLLRIDVDAVSTTEPLGLIVTIETQEP